MLEESRWVSTSTRAFRSSLFSSIFDDPPVSSPTSHNCSRAEGPSRPVRIPATSSSTSSCGSTTDGEGGEEGWEEEVSSAEEERKDSFLGGRGYILELRRKDGRAEEMMGWRGGGGWKRVGSSSLGKDRVVEGRAEGRLGLDAVAEGERALDDRVQEGREMVGR